MCGNSCISGFEGAQRMKKRRECIAVLLALALFLGIGWVTGQLLMPPRTEYGSAWDAYLQEPKESMDVLCFGSSLVYCSIIPAALWQESALRSFVLAGPEQTIPMTYYCLREACRTQSPRLVLLDCTAMFFPRYKNYTKANIGYLPVGANRLAATFRTAPVSEWPGLLFPIFNYHYRWKEITPADLRARLQPQRSDTAGYTVLTSAAADPGPAVWEEFSLENADYARNLEYLTKLRDYCTAHEIELLLYLTPTQSKLPTSSLETIRTDAAALEIEFADFNGILPALGVDDSTDWYDCLHFNLSGAEKFSRWLGAELSGRMAPTVAGAEAEALWQERAAYLDTLGETEEDG